MKTTYRSLLPAALLGVALLANSCASPPQSLAGQAGFVEAYFDATSLNNLMAPANCTHVRFYNARRVANDTKGTSIAIAVTVNAHGAPIYNGGTYKYKMHDKITGGTTPMTSLTDVQARAQIQFVKDAGEKSYATEFKKSDIQGFLASAGCNGVRLIPERLTSGYWTMRMHPAKLAGTGGAPNPAPLSMLCGEPCPNYCGDVPTNYIHL